MTRTRPYTVFMDGFLASYAYPWTQPQRDPRLADTTPPLHAGNYYVDEPFLVHAADGAWVMTLTLADGQEGDTSQRVVTMRSSDLGTTWSDPVDVEPADGPQVSKAILVLAGTGRLYVIYMYNRDGLTEVIGDDPPYPGGRCSRVDSLGYLCFRYSDDDGRSWSPDRYEIPVREFDIDIDNPYRGEIRFGMVSAVALVTDQQVFIPVTKVASFGEGLFSRSEGVIVASDNLLTESDVSQLRWRTLPEGRIGFRPPDGSQVSEEHSLTALSDGTLQNIFRTISGSSAVTYSTDRGQTWSGADWLRYPDGRKIKCPRAANFVWKCRNGRYLHWFHNHGGTPFPGRIQENAHYSFEDRNPVWVCAGVEHHTERGLRIMWSPPEIMLYSDDPLLRLSYPDMIEDDGRYFFTETNKDAARVHEVAAEFFDGMWANLDATPTPPTDSLVNLSRPQLEEVRCPRLPQFVEIDVDMPDYRSIRTRAGISIALQVELPPDFPTSQLISNQLPDGRGFTVTAREDGSLDVAVGDDMTRAGLRTETQLLAAGRHCVVVIIDSGPSILSVVIDGVVVDGGDSHQFGWGRFSPNLQGLNGGPMLRLASAQILCRVALYGRALRHYEAGALHRIWRDA